LRLVLTATLSVMLVGVAAASPAPQSTYAPQSASGWLGKYRGYSCNQLVKEARVVSVRAAAVAGEKHSRGDEIATTEATIVLPSVLDSTKQVAGEIAVLRGQMQAIEEAAIQSQCDIEFVPSTNQ
jgi:hypothetical protein